MSSLLEYLRRHIPRCTASSGKDVKLLLVHDAGQTEIRNQEICIVLRGAEEEVLGLEVAVDDSVVVEVGYGGEDGSDEVRGVGLVVATFSTDAVEEFSPESEVGD